MKHVMVFAFFLLPFFSSGQQRYFTRSGTITFKAGTAMEDIDAVNKAASSVLDISTGQVEIAVLVKGFEFKRALMQEHFNENYLESDRYPKSVFRGKVKDIEKIDFSQPGSHAVKIKGTLEIHGVTREMDAAANLIIKQDGIDANTNFSVLLSDYNITIPGLVKDKISKSVAIAVSCHYTLIK